MLNFPWKCFFFIFVPLLFWACHGVTHNRLWLCFHKLHYVATSSLEKQVYWCSETSLDMDKTQTIPKDICKKLTRDSGVIGRIGEIRHGGKIAQNEKHRLIRGAERCEQKQLTQMMTWSDWAGRPLWHRCGVHTEPLPDVHLPSAVLLMFSAASCLSLGQMDSGTLVKH